MYLSTLRTCFTIVYFNIIESLAKNLKEQNKNENLMVLLISNLTLNLNFSVERDERKIMIFPFLNRF